MRKWNKDILFLVALQVIFKGTTSRCMAPDRAGDHPKIIKAFAAKKTQTGETFHELLEELHRRMKIFKREAGAILGRGIHNILFA